MVNIIQILNTTVSGRHPPAGKLAGESYVNFADMQFGVADGTKNNDLLAVRFFSSSANYSVGDHIVQGGKLYEAIIPSAPGAFNAPNWSKVIISTDTAAFLPLIGGTLTNTLTINPPAANSALSLTSPANSAMFINSYRGALKNRWSLLLGDSSPESTGNAGSNFAIYRYDDTGAAIDTPISINRATGNVTVGGIGSLVIDGPAPPSTARSIYSTVAGSNRWVLALGTNEAESTGNLGSNFALYNYDNSGNNIGNPLIINRASGAATFSGAISAGGRISSSNVIATTASMEININGANRSYFGRTATGIARWSVTLGNATPESGGNVGSDFYIDRYADGTGTYIDSPFAIIRSTGNAAFAHQVSVAGTFVASNGFSLSGGANLFPIGGGNNIIQFYNASGTARGYVGWLNSDNGIYLVNNTSGAYIVISNSSATTTINGALSCSGNFTPGNVTNVGSETIAGNLAVSGNITTSNSITASGSGSFAGNLQVNNNANIGTVTSYGFTNNGNGTNTGQFVVNGPLYSLNSVYLENTGGSFAHYTTGGTSLRMQIYCGGDNNAYWINNIIGNWVRLTTDGGFYFSGSFAAKVGGGVWATYSDKRIKNVIGDYKAGLKEILQIKPSVFTYKGNDKETKDGISLHSEMANNKKEAIGLIADDVMKILPETVELRRGFIDGDEVKDLKTLDITNIIYALINAVKELSAEINTLKAVRSA
jgi:hypothetical protein